MTPTGIEPVSLPWKGSVFTAWLRGLVALFWLMTPKTLQRFKSINFYSYLTRTVYRFFKVVPIRPPPWEFVKQILTNTIKYMWEHPLTHFEKITHCVFFIFSFSRWYAYPLWISRWFINSTQLLTRWLQLSSQSETCTPKIFYNFWFGFTII